MRLSTLSSTLAVAAVLLGTAACAQRPMTAPMQAPASATMSVPAFPTMAPSPDPRVGLAAGLFDAEEATWNLRVVSKTPPPPDFVGVTNSDLAFQGDYAFQGNYNGIIVWDLSDPASPELVTEYVCPASQSDVSVYGNLMFVSGEGLGGRLDCGTEGVSEAVSPDRLRGIRIFDISDIRNPEYVSNVQTCRGSHTHSVLKDPDDDDNVYIYVSGSAGVRPAEELPGCSGAAPDEDPNSALFRIEVIRVPLANPTAAEIVNSPRIFEGLTEAPSHGLAPADIAAIEEAKARGAYVLYFGGQDRILPDRFVRMFLAEIVAERGGEGEPTAADSTLLRERLPALVQERFGITVGSDDDDDGEPGPGPNQCHDITLYPAVGLAGGACEGYGLLLDISDPIAPRRIDAVADSNFSYWHSATFNNDATKVLFTDEWGGGGQPKCRATDPYEWGANAIFELTDGQMDFKSYYKMPAPQTSEENCVAHNGSLIPVPGRDIMVQSWYQGGISVFDWTDASNPIEIAFHDRGPADAEQMASGGSWSVYWYNGDLVSSEISRGLDVFQLTPSPYLTQNEIDAANSVELDYLNAQGQPVYEWPATFALARAYADQLDRTDAMSDAELLLVRTALYNAEMASGATRARTLTELADGISGMAAASGDPAKARMLADAVRMLAQG
ncbi:LVIVD repeat-containing protein [Rubrivirga sp. IMCC45206]|uniref:LVIVD repeat-containing protein n=1 Tax=Rubrivirga sp. IMCC45206 TaxID=3391614 RepID=UPI00398FC35C